MDKSIQVKRIEGIKSLKHLKMFDSFEEVFN